MTALPKGSENKIQTFAQETLLFSFGQPSIKDELKYWVRQHIKEIKPDRLIVDAFPGGILGELTDLPELSNIKQIEYIARILKTDVYKKRINDNLPKFTKIWQIEELGKEQNLFIEKLVVANNASITKLKLNYPVSVVDSSVILPPNCWLIVHSGSEIELQELFNYAQDTAMLENMSPNFVVIGQIQRPEFLPDDIPYYSIYPVTSLLEKADKIISGAGFNIMQQMSEMKEKHLVIPFERALDDQFLRLELTKA